jgi:hypothetical protein
MISFGKFVIGSFVVKGNNGKIGEFHFRCERFNLKGIDVIGSEYDPLTKTNFSYTIPSENIGVRYELWIGWVIVWFDYYYQKKNIPLYSCEDFEFFSDKEWYNNGQK